MNDVTNKDNETQYKLLEYELYLECCKNSIGGCEIEEKIHALEQVYDCARKIAITKAIERERQMENEHDLQIR